MNNRKIFRKPANHGSGPMIIGIAGGSGSGKSWLADSLAEVLGSRAVRLSLDQFYRDRSHLPEGRRAVLNFDHPAAIDWGQFEIALTNLSSGRSARVPTYDFKTHSSSGWNTVHSKPVVVIDGLWLLRRPSVRRRLHIKVYMDCPALIRLKRRLFRDSQTRGRTVRSIREQFRTSVEPMHRKYVEGQKARADFVVRPGQSSRVVRQLARLCGS